MSWRENLRDAPTSLKFVVLVGVMSFFADFTYEGSRSVIGPYLGLLGAGALTISVVTGLGEFLGYGLRLVSGRRADQTKQYWRVAISGYVVQMAVVPMLALARSWEIAALLIILERVGKATRNPPRDAMLSHAARDIGFGKAFGLHEALDQFGATFGPLAVAFVLTITHGDYKVAFASLAVPAALTLGILTVARLTYPRPQDLEPISAPIGSRYPRALWIYLAAAALAAAGYADFPLIAYHFANSAVVSTNLIPIFYATAMAVGGLGSLLFGRLYDHLGIRVLVPLTVVSAAFAPLVFLGGQWSALFGMALWGLGISVQESIMPAALAPMVPTERRASAFGLFTGVYGSAWFLGSIAIGVLFDVSLHAVVGFCVVVELAALPFFVRAQRLMRRDSTTRS